MRRTPDDRLDDADRDAGLLEPRALLDVQLDVRRHGPARRLRPSGAARASNPAPRHRVDQPLAVDGRHLGDPRGVEQPAERPRAEQASVAALLVDSTPRPPGAAPCASAVLGDRLQALEPGEHAERAVEDAALGNRVDVRAGEDDRVLGGEGLGAEAAEGVAGRVDPRA